jgi:hypothetical protein
MGAARIGAMLLLNIPPPRTFVTMRNLLDRHCLRSLYGGEGTKEDVGDSYVIGSLADLDKGRGIFPNIRHAACG